MSEQMLAEILQADSWSVECNGQPFDDVRRFRGKWYFRDPISQEYRELSFCREVIPLFKNEAVQI